VTARYPARLPQVLSPLAPALVVVAVQMALFPTPLGISLQGVTIGLLGALVAVGMALIYRANRIVSFAQGDLGMVPAMLSVILVQRFAWHYLLGLGVGLVAGLVLGALVELAVIRRFFRAPRLILTVATIGLAQLLAVVTLLMPEWIGSLTGRETNAVAATAERIDFPWRVRFTVEPLIFDADYIVAWVVAPLALAAVALFLRYTDVGIALRGSAESADRASLLGVPVMRLNTYVWAVAGLLSFIGLYLRTGILGLPFGSTFTFTVLLVALAALMLGRLTRLPTIVASAIALGMLEQGVTWNDEIRLGLFTVVADEAVLITPIIGLVIVVALLAQRTGATRAEQDASLSWQTAGDVRPVPAEVRRLPGVRYGRYAVAGLVALVLLVLPHTLTARHSLLASAVAIYALVTMSIVMLTGWAGQVSLGQMGFVGIGAVVAASATNEWGLDLTLGLALAGLAGAAVAVLVGLPALRLRGLYLGIVTLAFGLATTSYFLNREFFDWVPTGRVDRPALLGEWHLDSPTRIYYVCLAGFALMAVLAQGVRRSRAGRVLIATRENERGAQAFGVSVVRAKLTAFAVSGFVAAFAGGLLVHHQQSFSVDLLGPDQSLLVFTSAVLGGLGSLLGAALGALYLQGGDWFLPADFHLLSTAAGVLLVLLLVPGGFSGLIYRGRDLWLRRVARRHGVVSPSLLADTRQLEAEVESAFEASAEAPDTVLAAPEPERAP
jgi:branched-chain amino acid transport system permease protein